MTKSDRDVVDASKRLFPLKLLGGVVAGGALLDACATDASPAVSETSSGSTVTSLSVTLATDLSSITGSTVGAVALAAHGFALGDSAGGVFVWVAAASAPAENASNTGMIFGSGSSGRWVRQWSGTINVRWLGAKGDNSTDDRVAIQNAIDYAAGLNAPTPTMVGATVYFPTGIYRISQNPVSSPAWKILLRSNVNIDGDGPSSELRSVDGGQGEAARNLASDSSTPISNVTIQNIAINGRESTILTQPCQRAGIYIWNGTDITIRNCTIFDTGDGIRVYGTSHRVKILGNTIRDIPYQVDREAIQIDGAHDSVVSDNTVENCWGSAGIKMEGYTGGVIYGNTITGNVIKNCILGILPAGGCVVTGNNITWDQAAATTAGIPSTYWSIGGAFLTSDTTFTGNLISGVRNSGILITYSQPIVQNIVITANILENIQANGTAYGVVANSVDGTTFYNFVISGNRIAGIQGTGDNRDWGIDFYTSASASTPAAKSITISNNQISGPMRGIRVAGNPIQISNCTITGNIIELGPPSTNVAIGMHLSNLAHVNVTGNVIRKASGASSPGTYGILLDAPVDKAVISANDANDTDTPFSASGSTPVLSGNLF